MWTKTANIEAVGVGKTSATFTTTKEGTDPVSLDIKIRVKAKDKIYEWLMLPLVKYYSGGFRYPISVFKSDRIIIQQGWPIFNGPIRSTAMDVSLLIKNRNPFIEDDLIIKNSSGSRIGRIDRLNCLINDRSELYDNELLSLIGSNHITQPTYYFFKRELWLVLDDITAPNENITITVSNLYVDIGGNWRNSTFVLDYHGDMTRDEAVTAGVKILDGNTGPNV